MELPIEIRGYLTPAQFKRFNELTEFEQQQFIYDFWRQKINPTMLLICTILGVHYLYLKQIGKQFLFWFSIIYLVIIGYFIWWIKDIVNYQKKAEEYNQAIIQKYL